LASSTAYLPGGIGWYRKTFDVAAADAGKTMTIQFDGVYCNSEVWVNGHYIAKRPYGYISFYYNITPYIQFGQKNTISVRVDHTRYGDTRWYSGSGIYRHVWLSTSNQIHIAQWGVQVSTPQVSSTNADVAVKINLANDLKVKKNLSVISIILDKDGKKIGETQTEAAVSDSLNATLQLLNIKSPILWDTDKAYQYSLVTKIMDGQQLLDQRTTKFGVRTAVFDANKGFLLNGKSIKLKGVCLHHDGGGVGAAVPEKIWRLRLEKLKTCGCNAIRTSHNPVAPEFLDLCDEMGFIVMEEAFDEWEYAKRKWINGWNQTIYGFDGYYQHFEQWSDRDLAAMIERDKNHPSIVMWSIGNEIDYANDPYGDPKDVANYNIYRPDASRMVDIAKRLKAVIKSIDQTRPVTMALADAQNSLRVGLPDVLDIVGYNYTESRYQEDHKAFPNRVIYGSENPHNYDGWLAVKNNDYICSQFLWTGIDYLGESNKFPVRSAYSGLLDLSNKEKTIYYWRQSMWSDKPMLAISARKKRANENVNDDPMAKLAWFVSEIEEKQHWNYQTGDSVLVIAYTNCAETELFLNGKSLGKKKYQASNSVIWWYVPYQAGEVKVVSKAANGKKFESYLKTTSEAASMKINADAQSIKADGQDVSLVEVQLFDKNNNPAYLSSNKIEFEVSGESSIIATDNGDAACQDNFKLPARKAFDGRCIAIVQSNGKKGKIKITAKSQGLASVSVEIEAK